jgi:chemotaxis protein CheD
VIADDGLDPRRRTMRYLHPGKLFVTHEDVYVTTLLGSCVAICAWDEAAKVGGINHFLLPNAADDDDDPLRYGDGATHTLLAELVQAGANAAKIRAKVFGGACVLHAMRENRDHLGARNVNVAIDLLERAGIPIMDKQVGGVRGRKLVVRLCSGSADVRLI